MSNSFSTPSAAISALGYTPEEEKNELESFVWEYYKTLHGIRPRWMNFQCMTLECLREEADHLGAEFMAQKRREEDARKEKIRLANEKAKEKRKFQKQFNSLAAAWPI